VKNGSKKEKGSKEKGCEEKGSKEKDSKESSKEKEEISIEQHLVDKNPAYKLRGVFYCRKQKKGSRNKK
jgi:hypothetical protein